MKSSYSDIILSINYMGLQISSSKKLLAKNDSGVGFRVREFRGIFCSQKSRENFLSLLGEFHRDGNLIEVRIHKLRIHRK
jgi:hypothetical protein